MYSIVLVVHSWLRWAALVAGVGATMAVLRETSGPSSSGRTDRWGLALVTALDVQMLLGLVLYLVVSPNMRAIRENLGAAMRDRVSRFWAVEHITEMLLAVVLVHVGRVLARKAPTPDAKRLRLLVCFGAATLLMLVGIPWPGLRAGRPLFRF